MVMACLGGRGVHDRCHVLYLPGLGPLSLQVMPVIGFPLILHLVGKTILSRIGGKSTPLPT